MSECRRVHSWHQRVHVHLCKYARTHRRQLPDYLYIWLPLCRCFLFTCIATMFVCILRNCAGYISFAQSTLTRVRTWTVPEWRTCLDRSFCVCFGLNTTKTIYQLAIHECTHAHADQSHISIFSVFCFVSVPGIFMPNNFVTENKTFLEWKLVEWTTSA